MAACHVYLLQCRDATYYCGCANDLPRRLRQHNGIEGGGARYTRSRRPVILLASVSCQDRSSALKLEAQIKKLPRKKKLPFLQGLTNAGT